MGQILKVDFKSRKLSNNQSTHAKVIKSLAPFEYLLGSVVEIIEPAGPSLVVVETIDKRRFVISESLLEAV